MTTTNDTAADLAAFDTALHPFERAGLGKAPFRFVGLVEKTYVACQGAPVQPGGTCAFCGTGIRYVCIVKSADGRAHDIGTDCVHKLEDERNTNDEHAREIRRLADKVKAAQRKLAADKRAAKAAAVTANLEATLADEANRAALAALPHPSPNAPPHASLLSWSEWMLANAGAAGRARVAKAITAALAAAE